MAMGAPLAFLQELDSKIGQSTTDRRALMLRHLTDLFLVSVEQYSEAEIDLVDDIFVRLVETIEESARALLAIRLAPIVKAPPKVLRVLACDDAIDVASSVLIQSESLDDETLIECATTKSQEHMLAISQRRTLSALVTDVLVERGDRHVVLSTAMNTGAKFSNSGFSKLVERVQGDDTLASCVAARPDLPQSLFEQLLEGASETVRVKLKAERQHIDADIDRAVDNVTARIRSEAATRTPWHAPARVLVESLNRVGQLNGNKLVEFARAGRLDDLVAGLALMGKTPADVVEQMLNDPHAEALLVLTKAIGLSWEITRCILEPAGGTCRRSVRDMEKWRDVFQRLKPATAHQILAFHRRSTRMEPTRQ